MYSSRKRKRRLQADPFMRRSRKAKQQVITVYPNPKLKTRLQLTTTIDSVQIDNMPRDVLGLIVDYLRELVVTCAVPRLREKAKIGPLYEIHDWIVSQSQPVPRDADDHQLWSTAPRHTSPVRLDASNTFSAQLEQLVRAPLFECSTPSLPRWTNPAQINQLPSVLKPAPKIAQSGIQDQYVLLQWRDFWTWSSSLGCGCAAVVNRETGAVIARYSSCNLMNPCALAFLDSQRLVYHSSERSETVLAEEQEWTTLTWPSLDEQRVTKFEPVRPKNQTHRQPLGNTPGSDERRSISWSYGIGQERLLVGHDNGALFVYDFSSQQRWHVGGDGDKVEQAHLRQYLWPDRDDTSLTPSASATDDYRCTHNTTRYLHAITIKEHTFLLPNHWPTRQQPEPIFDNRCYRLVDCGETESIERFRLVTVGHLLCHAALNNRRLNASKGRVDVCANDLDSGGIRIVEDRWLVQVLSVTPRVLDEKEELQHYVTVWDTTPWLTRLCKLTKTESTDIETETDNLEPVAVSPMLCLESNRCLAPTLLSATMQYL